jgi:Ca-activated chloride channel family protein
MKGFSWLVILLALLVLLPPIGYSQAGLLLSKRAGQTEWESVLTLDEMTVDIGINNQFAQVRVLQIFANPRSDVVEGRFVFALPAAAAISEFAVWDGDVRVPGVILEKRRAEELYESLMRQAIDPGLLKQDTEEEPETAFTVRVTPIPAYGYKRLEMAYTQTLPIDALQSRFSFPFRPSQYGTQRAGHLRINLNLKSQTPISGFSQEGRALPLNIVRQTPNELEANFEGNDIELTEDLAFIYSFGIRQSQLDFLAHRAPERIRAWEIRDPAEARKNPDGYFQAIAGFNHARMTPGQLPPPPPRSLIFMLDTSLSMQWEKLDRAYEALEYFLRGLTARDKFNLTVFNDDVQRLSRDPLAVNQQTVEQALQFVRQGYLSGGTNFLLALDDALEAAGRFGSKEVSLIMITDGNPTLGTTLSRRILQQVEQKKSAGLRAYIFGIGTDANAQFLGELARITRGHFASVRQTDEISFQLRLFWSKVGIEPVSDLALTASEKEAFYHVYPEVNRNAYDGTQFAFVGRYRQPRRNLQIRVQGKQPSGNVELSRKVDLPEREEANDHLPRVWARARVDALLREIELTGESQELIDEIIRLSRRYNFVTPYTAFLAAPRALLRPRVIRPGDPVLRVRTDPSVRSVVAVFPFGLVKALTDLDSEDVWETRFLAPRTMDDGQYQCRLILTDADGRVYEERKAFTIDSRPPRLRARLSRTTVHAGDEVTITVDADQDTRRLAARMYGAQPVSILWNQDAKASVGRLRIPEGLPSGIYAVTILAEDFAHNSSSLDVQLEVIGGSP